MQAGELRTRIRIQKQTCVNVNGGSDTVIDDITYIGEDDARKPAVYPAKWEDFNSTEALEGDVQKIFEVAQVTIRYLAGLDMQHYIVKGDASLVTEDEIREKRYEIISIKDPEDKHVWLVLRARRAVNK